MDSYHDNLDFFLLRSVIRLASITSTMITTRTTTLTLATTTLLLQASTMLSQAATIQLPDIIITGTSISTNNQSGVSYRRGQSNTHGSHRVDDGTVVANNGDTLVLTIRPEAGKQFKISDGYLALNIQVNFARERSPIVGGTVLTSMSGQITYNGLQGGTVIGQSFSNNFIESPAPTGAAPDFTGSLVTNVRGSAGFFPYDAGGDVTFDSVTIEVTNLVSMDWVNQPLDGFDFNAVYPAAANVDGFSIEAVPEPSQLALLGLALPALVLRRRK